MKAIKIRSITTHGDIAHNIVGVEPSNGVMCVHLRRVALVKHAALVKDYQAHGFVVMKVYKGQTLVQNQTALKLDTFSKLIIAVYQLMPEIYKTKET